jgi:hypothetical protein
MLDRPARLASASIGVLLAVLTMSGAAQDTVDVERLVTRFLATTEEYEKTFQNLVAEETKTIEVFNRAGKMEKRRLIVSDLLVYRSPGDARATTEYRDVKTVDGKAIENRRERAMKLVTRAASAKTLEKELEAIDRETSQYEFRRHLRGYTIHQAGVFKLHRAAFEVTIAGGERMNDREVVVLDYKQTGRIPGFLLPLPKEFGNPPRRHRGRFWLDAETGQSWREVWELVVSHPAAAEPLVMLRAERVYNPSRFGILVPQRIVFEWLRRFDHPKKGRPSFELSERTTFAYDAFRRFDVTTTEAIRVP